MAQMHSQASNVISPSFPSHRNEEDEEEEEDESDYDYESLSDGTLTPGTFFSHNLFLSFLLSFLLSFILAFYFGCKCNMCVSTDNILDVTCVCVSTDNILEDPPEEKQLHGEKLQVEQSIDVSKKTKKGDNSFQIREKVRYLLYIIHFIHIFYTQ